MAAAGRGDAVSQMARDPALAGRLGDGVVPLRAEPEAVKRGVSVMSRLGGGAGLFLLFALPGIAGILLVRLVDGSATRAAALAAALLVGFAGVAWRQAGPHRQPGLLGERCAYLGLLFTLAGIAASLVAPGGAASFDRLVADSGVALTAAIIGVALRILLLQAGAEPEPPQRPALHDRAAELESQVGLAVAELERFRLRTQQVLAERLARSTDGFAEQARAQAEAIAALSAGMMQRIDASLRAHADRTEALSIAAAESEARRVAALDRAVIGMAEVEARMQAIAARLGESAGTLAQGVAGVALLGKALPAAAAAADSLRVALTAQAEAVRLLAISSAEDARAVRAQRDQMLADLDASREALGRTQRTMAEIAKAVADRLGG
jgi:hypothetical protein